MELDYDKMVILDAEDLAEGGVKQAYESLQASLRVYVAEPLDVNERLDSDAPSYVVTAGETEYVVYGPGIDEESSWGRATFALFSIVNLQMARSAHKFFAINGGNDLGGMFLTPTAAEEAKKSLPRPTDWPYIPTDEAPWFGQYH